MQDVLDTLKKLPDRVLTTLNTDRSQVISIRRGVMGYFPVVARPIAEGKMTAQEYCDAVNGPDITRDQIEAMENGSMFGWHVPGADPDHVRAVREEAERKKVQS